MRPPARRFRFHAELLRADDRNIVLTHRAFPSKPLHIDGNEVMAAGYTAVWFLFKGEPYDVARFYRPDGTWTGYYVDVLEPVRWEGSDPATLSPLIDLFLDLWITPDGASLTLDEDEFQEAVDQGYLTPEQGGHARRVLGRLLAEIQGGTFPPEVVRQYVRGC